MSTSIELLQSALNEYRKAEANLVAYRDKAETAQRQAKASIDDFETSEGAAANKLAHWQVLESRLKNREQELNRSISELGKTTARVSNELNALVRDAWGKRRDIIGLRGCQAMGIDPKSLELGELDTVLELSGPLNAIRVFEVPVYNAKYIETVKQKAVQFVTTNIGDREVLEPLTTDREPVITQTLDKEHLIAASEKILENFAKLAEEIKREI